MRRRARLHGWLRGVAGWFLRTASQRPGGGAIRTGTRLRRGAQLEVEVLEQMALPNSLFDLLAGSFTGVVENENVALIQEPSGQDEAQAQQVPQVQVLVATPSDS